MKLLCDAKYCNTVAKAVGLILLGITCLPSAYNKPFFATTISAIYRRTRGGPGAGAGAGVGGGEGGGGAIVEENIHQTG